MSVPTSIVKPLKRLDEVTLMRTILALMIVFMHAFTCYNGSWEQPEGYTDVPFYRWVARVSFAFTLEAFVFISGYLYAFQRITLGRRDSLSHLIINKFKRLIIPSIIFSAAYFGLFYTFNGVGDMVLRIIEGCGHLWYLPMLFWCYLVGWLLVNIKGGDCLKMMILVILYLLPGIGLPLRLSSCLSYLCFFYGGFLMYKYARPISSSVTLRQVSVLWLVFILLFLIFRPLRDMLSTVTVQGFLSKICIILGRKVCHLIYASAGVIALYLTTVYRVNRHQVSALTNSLASCCFGIYLFQQFILQFLYYKTSLPLIVGPYWLPWLGFLIAIIISYTLTIVCLHSRIGRFLIG